MEDRLIELKSELAIKRMELDSQKKTLLFLKKEELHALDRHAKLVISFSKALLYLDELPLGKFIFEVWRKIKKKEILSVPNFKVEDTIIVKNTFTFLKIKNVFKKRGIKKVLIHILYPRLFISKIDPSPIQKKAVRSASLLPNRAEVKRINVCLFTAHLGPGGAERQLVLLAKELLSNAFNVSIQVMSPIEGELAHYLPSIQENNISVSSLDTSRFAENIITLVKYKIDPELLLKVPLDLRKQVASLACLLLEKKIDVIHSYLDEPNIVAAWAGLIAKTPAVRLSFRNSNPSHFPHMYTRDYKPLYKQLLAYDQIQLEANNYGSAVDYAKWLGINKSRIAIVHNGKEIKKWCKTDQKKRKDIRTQLGIKKNEIVVLSVSRLSPEKRPLDLVKLASILEKHSPPIRFIHVGIGGQEKEVKAAAKKFKITNINFLGKKDNMSEIISAADIFLQTSEFEGMSNAVMEAMLLGLPIVSTNVGGTPEIVLNGIHGLLHNVGDIENMAKSINMLSTSSNRRKEMGNLGRKYIIQNFSSKKFIEKIRREYHNQLNLKTQSGYRVYYSASKKTKILNSFLTLYKATKNSFDLLIDKLNKKTLATSKWIYLNLDGVFFVKWIIIHKVKKQFFQLTGHHLILEKPKTFSEKLQWLKLYYRNPLMTMCADKYRVREYVKNKIGEKYLTSIYGVYKNPDEINLSVLPKRFVLKVNHGSGQNIICNDKSALAWTNSKPRLNLWLENNHYLSSFEWSYKDIEPKIVCEQLLLDNNEIPEDYKFFCFHGVPRFVQLDIGRFSRHRRNLYDMQWRLQKFTLKFEDGFDVKREPPENFEKMKELAAVLSKDFIFVRVDFFNIKGKIYFGEMTFYPGNGTEKFTPNKWDRVFGSYLKLPLK